MASEEQHLRIAAGCAARAKDLDRVAKIYERDGAHLTAATRRRWAAEEREDEAYHRYAAAELAAGSAAK